jgi:hypothetical protein
LAGALSFDEKIRQNVALFWFLLPDVEILYSRAVIQRTIDVSPAFLEHGSAENIQDQKLKKFKTYSSSCPFQGLSNGTTLMQIQSGRTVPLKQF